MEITFWGKLLFAFLISAIICIIAAVAVKRCKDAKVGLGCGLMFPITFVVLIVIHFLTPTVIVIVKTDSGYTYNEKAVLFSYKMSNGSDIELSLGKNYIANETNDAMLLYPVYYGPKEKESSVVEADPIIINAHSVEVIKHTPDTYFSQPTEQIRTKSSSIVERWILEPFNTVAERECLY